MITIDLAFDKEIAKELTEYLSNLGMPVKQENSEIFLDAKDFDEKILGVFLEKTKRSNHVIQKIDSKSFLISKRTDVEDLGLGTCEICGLVATEDKLYSHRWTHGA